ncbi:MAG TPA: PIN domain-containing protein [Longimicrobium sp.]
MGILIDTSVLIDAERGRLDLAPHLAARTGEQVFLSAVSVSELLYGAYRDTGTRNKRLAVAEAVLTQFKVLQIDTPATRLHPRIKADLAARGTPVGPHDLWLAASAMAHGLTMATANLRDFQRIPGLQVEAWT